MAEASSPLKSPELPPLLALRSERGGLGVAAALLALLGFLPQLGGPGYDFALVCGVVLPSAVAITHALGVARTRPLPFAAVTRGIALGTVFGLVALLIALLHGLRAGFCDPAEGFSLVALGGGFGALMGGASGAFAGLFAARVERPRLRVAASVALGLSGPLLGVALSLARFYTSPMVFAYDPYFGYFSGPLYDTVIASLWPLVTYRLGSVATLLALVAMVRLVETPETGGGYGLHFKSRPGVACAGLAAAAVSLAISAAGTELGHFSTVHSIEQALGRKLRVGRCEVVYSSAIQESDARRLGRECGAHLLQIERFFATNGPEQVRVYLFANDVEKGRLMGAAHTYIAKPWRHEVYVQAAGFPHPVLGHELAHVVSESFGAGPFRVAGLWGGLIPDPGRIEGVATAASPDENDALTLSEWAAAMQRLGLLPGVDSLFQLGFFGHNAARAYTAAGAFIEFLRREHGPAAVRRWYHGEPLAKVVSRDIPTLERRFRQSLEQVPLTDAMLANARARFERPSFFERRCPRIIDREVAEANERLQAADFTGARRSFTEVLRLDPHDSGARLGLQACNARAGHLNAAITGLAALAAAPDLAPWARLVALEHRADALLQQGQVDAAREQYAALAAQLADEDRLRTLDVKREADEGLAREAILALLLGDEQGPSWDVAAPKLGEWSARDAASGLADYLVGKNLFNRGRIKDAALYLDRALSRSLPAERIVDEALRLRFVAACALFDHDAAIWAYDRLRARPLSRARRFGLDRLAERCTI
jgi:hypothetical protein